MAPLAPQLEMVEGIMRTLTRLDTTPQKAKEASMPDQAFPRVVAVFHGKTKQKGGQSKRQKNRHDRKYITCSKSQLNTLWFTAQITAAPNQTQHRSWWWYY